MKTLTLVAAALLATTATTAVAAPITYTLTGQFSGTVNGGAFSDVFATFVGRGDTAARFTAQDANFVPLTSATFTAASTTYTIVPQLNFWSSPAFGSSGFKYFPAPDVYAFRGLGSYDNNSSLAATPVTGYFFGNFSTTSGDQFALTSSSGTQFSAQLAAVPEPATWGMMILGFGAMGFAMRRRAKVRTNVSFA